MKSRRYPVAILGATGTVGQKLVRLLAEHPWFEIRRLAASERSAGKPYGEAVRWREPVELPRWIAEQKVEPVLPPVPGMLAFSAIEADLAAAVEQGWARAGSLVVSNTKTHRLDSDVPLLIPEVNSEHLSLLDIQRKNRGWSGGIVTNPNCSTTGLALLLAPLHRAAGVDQVTVTTMQAVSGAGYPGVASLDILGNVIPWISGEEEKLAVETARILGTPNTPAPVTVSATTTRVPTIDGHLLTVGVRCQNPLTAAAAADLLEAFRGPPSVAELPSSPSRPIEVDYRNDHPQPRLDLDRGNGMTVTVGRLRSCPIHGLALVALVHNTIRGAAGAAIQNAELLAVSGYLDRGCP